MWSVARRPRRKKKENKNKISTSLDRMQAMRNGLVRAVKASAPARMSLIHKTGVTLPPPFARKTSLLHLPSSCCPSVACRVSLHAAHGAECTSCKTRWFCQRQSSEEVQWFIHRLLHLAAWASDQKHLLEMAGDMKCNSCPSQRPNFYPGCHLFSDTLRYARK